MGLDLFGEERTKVVNLRKDTFDVYIGRKGHGEDGYFGNPIRLKKGMYRGNTLSSYKWYFNDRMEKDPHFRDRIHKLKGKTLGCFCKPNACHGDVIANYLNKDL